jgi:hypothetical protein
MSAIAITIQKLLASPDVIDIVEDRIFPIMAPQGAVRPYIVVHLIDNGDSVSLNGAARYYRTIVQTDSYAEMTPAGAVTVMGLGDAVIEALNGVVKEEIAGCADVDILLGSTDSTDSFLEANTHRRYTQFSCRWRRAPGAVTEEPELPEDESISFSITAAANNGAIGYSGSNNFQGRPVFGSLSVEPIPEHRLQALYRVAAPSNTSIIAFSGDASALLAGKHVFVDGVDFGPGVQYGFAYTNGVTIWARISGGPEFVAGRAYEVEIKEPQP